MNLLKIYQSIYVYDGFRLVNQKRISLKAIGIIWHDRILCDDFRVTL